MVECIHLKDVFSLQESHLPADYYSSYKYAYRTLEVLGRVMEGFKIHKASKTVMENSTEDGFIKIFSIQQDNGKLVFFYMRDENEFFNFNIFEFEEGEGINNKRVFKSFEAALHDSLIRFNNSYFLNIRIHPRYQSILDAYYHQHLKGRTALLSQYDWKIFLN